MAKKQEKKSPFVLIILDGFGLAPPSPSNAITKTTAKRIFGYMDRYPTAQLTAHGKDVGLFSGQEGNSEAGHLAIGSGRVIKQDAVVISDAIDSGIFFKNHALLHAMNHVKKKRSATLHLMGLLTNGDSAHAHPEHLYALLDMAYRKSVRNVAIHLFTDGRDSSPHGAAKFLKELRDHMYPGQYIRSVMGRFYAMDRSKVWSRTQAAYEALVDCKGHIAESPEAAASLAYNRGETDEFIRPTLIVEDGEGPMCIKDGDGIIFFNSRSDRARQLTKAFLQPDFQKMNHGGFQRSRMVKDVPFVAMSEFGPDLPDIITAFPTEDVPNCLAKAIGHERKQLFIAETEKYAHITYFLNGGYPKPINGEDQEFVLSRGDDTYAKYPQMYASKVTDNILGYFEKEKYDFVCVNYPNADIVGHTGNVNAAKEAVKAVDKEVCRLVSYVLRHGGTAVITADHGNAEYMKNPHTGEVVTEHTTNPVPCIVINKELIGKRIRKRGTLADVAPTVLKLLGRKKPADMTGTSLL